MSLAQTLAHNISPIFPQELNFDFHSFKFMPFSRSKTTTKIEHCWHSHCSCCDPKSTVLANSLVGCIKSLTVKLISQSALLRLKSFFSGEGLYAIFVQLKLVPSLLYRDQDLLLICKKHDGIPEKSPLPVVWFAYGISNRIQPKGSGTDAVHTSPALSPVSVS